MDNIPIRDSPPTPSHPTPCRGRQRRGWEWVGHGVGWGANPLWVHSRIGYTILDVYLYGYTCILEKQIKTSKNRRTFCLLRFFIPCTVTNPTQMSNFYKYRLKIQHLLLLEILLQIRFRVFFISSCA